MKQAILVLIAVLLVVLGIIGATSLYIVPLTEQVIITQFGEPVGLPKSTPGLKFKMPYQVVNRFENRTLEWDGPLIEMPTKDKTFINVDCYARWRITDPLAYFKGLKDERTARSRLDDILGSETRKMVGNHPLVEVIRTDKDRQAELNDTDDITAGTVDATLKPITLGRSKLEQEIKDRAKNKLAELGIELLDVRFKRVNYKGTVLKDIYDRMVSERQQIAERFRSEGDGEAARILGRTQLELKQIESGAYLTVQGIRGQADAEAAKIYAEAYNQSPQAAEFYEFYRTMEIYQTIIGGETTMILSTDSDIFQFMKGLDPVKAPAGKPVVVPSAPPAPKPPVVVPPGTPVQPQSP